MSPPLPATQPCNYSGFVEPLEFYAQYAIVDFDCEEGLEEKCYG